MSLNDTYESLQLFARELREFDERLRAGEAEIRRLHTGIDAIWRDSLRSDYDRLIGEFEQQVAMYADSRSDRFEQFLQAKLAQLRAYLHGS